MKRHEKPYGCTYSQCEKRFGSKNDWKRHENSQHFLIEAWKCDLALTDRPEEPCRRSCFRRETFRQHLQKDHQMDDIKSIDEKLDGCRLGRNCDSRFWCGFCEDIIPVMQEEGKHAWAERFDHIDDHLFGRGKFPPRSINEWKGLESDSRRKDESRASSRGRGRSFSMESIQPSSQVSAVTISNMQRKRQRETPGDLLGEVPKRQKTMVKLWTCVCLHPTRVLVPYQASCLTFDSAIVQ